MKTDPYLWKWAQRLADTNDREACYTGLLCVARRLTRMLEADKRGLRAACDELHAQAAAMREALEKIECRACEGMGKVCGTCTDPHCGEAYWDHVCGLDELVPCPVCAGTGKRGHAALAPDAGKALLERLRMAEEAANDHGQARVELEEYADRLLLACQSLSRRWREERRRVEQEKAHHAQVFATTYERNAAFGGRLIRACRSLHRAFKREQELSGHLRIERDSLRAERDAAIARLNAAGTRAVESAIGPDAEINALRSRLAALEGALLDAEDKLRSARSVADAYSHGTRTGGETSWAAFRDRMSESIAVIRALLPKEEP